ncbi:MAG TPA: phosphoribosylaminoimidazolesuccinocarboxamide synthase [Steroidobacteraceae bacterium]|nr:phosphoribosylaminoimidazolesuccinocarboxamide synthase [Steroidobacteraceae bacterium]
MQNSPAMSNSLNSSVAASPPMRESRLQSLKRIHQGKVRDIYAIDEKSMLIVTTDRLSAFDVILPDPIPGKGRVLTEISRFWFNKTTHLIPNQLLDIPLASVVTDVQELALIADRSLVVRRLKALPVEAVVRGYIIGSGWKEYQSSGSICGIKLPTGLKMADKLPEAMFTPTTKAPMGTHDENIDFATVEKLIGAELAQQVRDTAIALYRFAADYALQRGIIIADTKFEFGIDEQGTLVLIDEALTPDSSRFWPVDTYKPGSSPASFDKQFIRDYLETLSWNKQAPGPSLPADIIKRTTEKYQEVAQRLMAE